MIKLLVLDVDGCLTDGSIVYAADATESKSFNVKDGLAIATWVKMGYEVAIITGRDSSIVAQRAKELRVGHLYQGIKNKKEVLQNIMQELQLTPSEVAAIGDDFNDYKMLSFVGRSFTPKDGVDGIKKIVDTVLSKKGGKGAVREMIDIIVKENNLEDDFLSVWI